MQTIIKIIAKNANFVLFYSNPKEDIKIQMNNLTEFKHIMRQIP